MLVVGIGNVLLGDDGFGPSVVEMLRAGWELPNDVELLDAGTPGLDLGGRLYGRSQVLVLDAVSADAQPGAILRYCGAELAHLPIKPRVSPHDPALAEALALVALAGESPVQVTLIGVVPVATRLGLGLSPAVERAAREVVMMVLQEIEEWVGHRLVARSGASCEAWWLDQRLRPVYGDEPVNAVRGQSTPPIQLEPQTGR